MDGGRMKLGKLNKIDLRDVWKHEALDFTSWLSKEENLKLLSEEIGTDISLIETEAPIGRYSVDILCEEEISGKKIIIENQLEKTNHDHLGKLITYASGHDASYILWIVRDYNEEHRQAIDWLNEQTNEGVNFFLIKVELWRIGNSAPAPKFNIVAKPNEWTKLIRNISSNKKITEGQIVKLEFWTEMKNYFYEKGSKLPLRTPRPHSWFDLSIGTSQVWIRLVMTKKEMRCQLFTSNKELFQSFVENKDDIEGKLEEKVKFHEPEKTGVITMSSRANIDKREKWVEYFSWFQKRVEKTYYFFRDYAPKLLDELDAKTEEI